MEYTTLGQRIAALRKEKGMTQAELAEKMGVTDKAVSKWERDLSCPDIGSLPVLASVMDVSIDDLLQGGEPEQVKKRPAYADTVDLVLKVLPVGLGVGVAALSAMGQIRTEDAVSLLSVGLASAGLYLLRK